MDAKERLLRYLEQRRELGETELVLDSMPVEDVMRLLGATQARAASASRTTQSAPERRDAPASPVVPADETPVIQSAPPPPPPMREAPSAVGSDWRKALTDATGEKPSPAGRPEVAGSVPSSSLSLPAWLAATGVPVGVQARSEAFRVHLTAQEGHIRDLPTLDAIASAVATCQRCALYQTATHPVPGAGNPGASFVCVGEAPGQAEDEQGIPFVGAAGQLLTKILAAIGFSRDDVFICNVLKHRPPGNRDPLPGEVLACSPYLLRQLELIKPKVILALGSFAARTLLMTDSSIGKLRGKVHMFDDIPVIVTYHPAALLRNEAWKRPAWEDVQLARRIHDAAPSVQRR